MMVENSEKERDIFNVNVPVPTLSYSPVSHKSFIELIKDVVKNLGYSIVNFHYMTNKSGTQLVGKYELDYKEEDMRLMVGFKNSYDKTMSAGIAIGANVIVCSNGMVTGEYDFKRRHTGNISNELDGFVNNTFDTIEPNIEKLINFRSILINIELNEAEINELIGGLYMNNLVRLEQLSLIKQELITPKFDHKVPTNNLWSIYNACTYALDRRSHPHIYFSQHSLLIAEFINYIKNLK